MIEILVVRDPDSANEIRVWQDGVEVSHVVTVISVDAGAGYEYDDWTESADAALADSLTDEFRVAAFQAFLDPPGKTYIDGWPEEN